MFRLVLLFSILPAVVLAQSKKDLQRINDSLRVENYRLTVANENLNAANDSLQSEMKAIEKTNALLMTSTKKQEELTGILRSAVVQERNLPAIIFQYGDYGIGIYSIRV
jgi:hypothetical protein